LTVQIVPSSSSPLQFAPLSQLPSATVGTSYRYQFTASGGATPYTFAMTQGSLPPGTQFSAQGLLSGTPSQAGLYSFAVEVCDSSAPQPQCLSGTSTVAVNAPPTQPLQIMTTSLPNGVKGVLYDTLLRGQGGIPPYRWSSSSPLPQGVQLTTAGEIKGTPTQSGTFTLNIMLSDSHGTSPVIAKLALTVTQSAPVITTTTLPGGTVGKAYPVTPLQASGGQPPYTWTIAAGSLPAGLRMTSTGSISGTPTSTGSLKSKTSTFTAQLADAGHQTASANLSITVQPQGAGPLGVASRLK
jgi:large repetitive protein